ncbi:hypothetical protein AAMO2058_000610800 [Amorphochlora amoebiformis]
MSRDFGGRFPLRPNSLLKVHEGRERSHSNTGLLSVLSNDTHGNEVAGVFSDAFRATNNDEKCEPLQPTFYCFICLNNVKASQGYSLRNCGHSFCRKCLGRYLHSQFKSRQTHPRCFHITESKGACNMEIHPDDIKAASTEEAWKQYIYFSNKENNENYIDCPKCKTQQLGDPLQPWTECKNHGCGHQFCFVHQNQHAKEVLCADYEAQVRMEEKKTSAWRASNTKKCPKCGVSTEKNEGCNHMTCYICKTGWCWLCGEVIGKQVLPQHYREGKCKGKQFTEQNVPYMAAWEAAFCIMVPALFLLLLSPIAFVMALVACLLSPLLYSFVWSVSILSTSPDTTRLAVYETSNGSCEKSMRHLRDIHHIHHFELWCTTPHTSRPRTAIL